MSKLDPKYLVLNSSSPNNQVLSQDEINRYCNMPHKDNLLKSLTQEQLKYLGDKVQNELKAYTNIPINNLSTVLATTPIITSKPPQPLAPRAPEDIKQITFLEPFFDSRYTDKHLRSYIPVYERILALAYTSKTPFNMLEVGIYKGGSILAWCKAFPNATVIGVDCQKTVSINLPNFKESITNAYCEEFLELIPANSQDFIIDDGSHAYNDLIFVCENYHKLLKKGGVLVLEDIPNINWIPKLRALGTKNGCICEVIDLREKKKRWNDLLLIFKKV